MRVARPRFTIRRLMILVALAAVLLAGFDAAVRLQRARVRRQQVLADLMARTAIAARQAAFAPAPPAPAR